MVTSPDRAVLGRSGSTTKNLKVAYWATTCFFSLWMLFTAYAQLVLPQVHQMFVHLGFPDYFRVELSVAKIVGVLVLLAPAPARLKEWTYAGFAITLTSAVIAHLSVGDGAAIYMWSVVAGLNLGLSYFFYRKSSTTTFSPTELNEMGPA